MQNKGWVPGAVRLKWRVDRKGYRPIKLGELRRLQRHGPKDAPVSKLSPAWLMKRRASAATTITTSESIPDNEVVIAPLGGGERSYDVSVGEQHIYLDIANGDAETARWATEFACKWGLLADGPYMLLEEFTEMRRQLRKLLDGKSSFRRLAARNEGLRLGVADITIARTGPKEALEVFWYVRSLRSFCWLEYLAAIGGAIDIQRCPECRQYFRKRVKGPVGIYCGGACKQAAFRKRQHVTSR